MEKYNCSKALAATAKFFINYKCFFHHSSKITHPIQENEETALAAHVGGQCSKEFVHFYEVKFQRAISERVIRQLKTTQMPISTETEQVMFYPH